MAYTVTNIFIALKGTTVTYFSAELPSSPNQHTEPLKSTLRAAEEIKRQ